MKRRNSSRGAASEPPCDFKILIVGITQRAGKELLTLVVIRYNRNVWWLFPCPCPKDFRSRGLTSRRAASAKAACLNHRSPYGFADQLWSQASIISSPSYDRLGIKPHNAARLQRVNAPCRAMMDRCVSVISSVEGILDKRGFRDIWFVKQKTRPFGRVLVTELMFFA